MNALHKYRYCFMAGLCAAGGSFFGKLPSFLNDRTLLLANVMPVLTPSVEIYAGILLINLKLNKHTQCNILIIVFGASIYFI